MPFRARRAAGGPSCRAAASATPPDENTLRGAGLAAGDRAVGPVGALGDNELVGPKQHAAAAPLGVGVWCRREGRFVFRLAEKRGWGRARNRRGIGASPVDDDVEAGVPPEGDRQELEKLGITARDHNQVVRHPP